MNHNASELFPGWYSKALNKEVAAEEITLRKKSIAESLKIDQKDTWLLFLKVYLGLSKFGSDEYAKVVDHVKKGDDNFSLQNEHLVRILAGATIAHKIDVNKDLISDLLAMGVLCSEILPLEESIIPELNNRALLFWETESEKQRKLVFEMKAGGSLKSSAKLDLTEVTAESVTKVLTGLQKDINSANVDVNAISAKLSVIRTNFIALSEETSILWWLFAAYSESLRKPFKKLTPDVLSIVAPIELNKLTVLASGISGEGILMRALAYSEFEDGVTHSISTVIESIKEFENQIKPIMPKCSDQLSFSTSLIQGVKSRLDYAGSEWIAVAGKLTTLDFSKKLTYEKISIQLYKEFTMAKIYERI